MELAERHIRNIFIYMFPKFAGYGLSLITLPILTRILTPHDFGVVALVWMFPAIALSIIPCGVIAGAQRNYFEYKNDERKLNALFFSSQLFLCLVLFMSFAPVFFFKNMIAYLTIKDTAYGLAVFIAFVTASFGQLANFYLILYQNMEKAKLYSVFTMMQALITAAANLFFVWYCKMSYMGLLYGALLGSFITCVFLVFNFNRQLVPVFSKDILIKNMRYGLQLLPKSFTGFVQKFFDKYMLNSMLSLSAVGVYNIGQNIGNSLFCFMNTVWSSVQPLCYREVFDKGKDASVSAGRLFTIFSYIALTPVLLLILFASELVYIIAPEPYYKAIDIIILISGGMATQVFGMYAGVQYAYSKKAYLIFPITVLSTLVNVGINILLIPRLGLIGAGISMVITLFVLNGVAVFVGQKIYRIGYEWKTIAALLAVIMGAMVSVLSLRFMGVGGFYLYVVKLAFILLFINAGIKSAIITRGSLSKAFNAFAVRRKKENRSV